MSGTEDGFPVMSDYELPWTEARRESVVRWRESVEFVDGILARMEQK